MVRQSGNTLINNKSWAQIAQMGTGVHQKLQQNNLQSKKAQSKTQTKQQTQSQRTNTQQLKQVKQYLDKSKSSVKQNKKFVTTTQYPRSISSAQLKALQQEYQGLCNLFNANNYFGKSVYSQKKAWIQTKGRCVISVASCYSLRHKPVQNLVRPQQKRAMKNGGLKFVPKQNKNVMKQNKNQKNKSQQPKFGESKQSNWGTEKAWGKNQPKQIREPPKEQAIKQQQLKQQQQQMDKIQQRHRKQMELLQKAQLKQQELLLKKQTEQRKKLLQYQKQQKMRLQSQTNQRSAPVRQAQAPVKKTLRTVNQKPSVKQAKPLRHRLEAVRKQNQLVGNDTFKYTLNQLVDAMNYYPKKSYSSDRAWKYNKFLGGYFSSASYFAQKNAPFVPSSRPRVNVTNGLPVYTFSVKPTTKSVITPYNSNLQGVRTDGNGRYFEHWHIGSIWTHYYSKPKARRV
ncbi:hypothetical protein PIROE2DRAFT_68586 [Piromyces sp. E2]|nr:hypothetical protein PIROE2DRAFT_68586 [Piromyces sp. E2]|eukprot:OUM69190.1 hypothetical protein PIROE2DRAFT_68586 [Piromyces sp. E2]